MSNEAKTPIEQALALPPEDRIALVEDVLDSLDRRDPEVDRPWAQEAPREDPGSRPSLLGEHQCSAGRRPAAKVRRSMVTVGFAHLHSFVLVAGTSDANILGATRESRARPR